MWKWIFLASGLTLALILSNKKKPPEDGVPRDEDIPKGTWSEDRKSYTDAKGRKYKRIEDATYDGQVYVVYRWAASEPLTPKTERRAASVRAGESLDGIAIQIDRQAVWDYPELMEGK